MSGLQSRSSLKRHTTLSRQNTKLKSSGIKPGRSLAKKPNKPKTITVAVLKKKADSLFSKLIRYRDGQKSGEGWVVQCITCQEWRPISMMQCGHFMSRVHNSTRFDEQNCNAQCYACNVMMHGRQYEYGLRVDLKYGSGTAAKLHQLARETKKFTKGELLQLIDNFKKEVAEYEAI